MSTVAGMADVWVELRAPRFVVHRHNADLRCEHNVNPDSLYKVRHKLKYLSKSFIKNHTVEQRTTYVFKSIKIHLLLRSEPHLKSATNIVLSCY